MLSIFKKFLLLISFPLLLSACGSSNLNDSGPVVIQQPNRTANPFLHDNQTRFVPTNRPTHFTHGRPIYHNPWHHNSWHNNNRSLHHNSWHRNNRNRHHNSWHHNNRHFHHNSWDRHNSWHNSRHRGHRRF